MTSELADEKINVKMKLAALWSSFMFLYIYVDYFHLYMPSSIKDILAGKMFVFDITQVALLSIIICYSWKWPKQENQKTHLRGIQ